MIKNDDSYQEEFEKYWQKGMFIMDIIDRAIEKKLHISDKEEFKGQTWEMFEKEVKGRKLFLFGVGASANVFFQKYRNTLIPSGIIDNDRDKQGRDVRAYCEDAWEYLEQEIRISDITIFEKYAPEEMVIVITSTNYYEQIALQLQSYKIYNYFSILIMEADKRKNKAEGAYVQSDQYKKYMQQCMSYPIESRKIVLRAFADYADHEKYMTEALMRERTDLNIVWLVSDINVAVPQGVRLVSMRNRKQVMYEMATAKVWISDLPILEYVEKRSGQIYIQTKHWASITLKKFYMDTKAFDNEPKKLALWKREQRMIDYILVGSEFDKESCRRGFGKEEGFVNVGSPRSDSMFRLEVCRSKVYEYFGLADVCKILLYAPTYRFDAEKGNSVHQSKNIEMDLEKVRTALQHRFGGNWNIMLRLHPSVKKAIKNMKLPEFVIDASEYGDSQELVATADITVSDYSSIMFEPAFVLKPVFLFATDKKEYMEKEFELLIDYDSLPFPIAESNEELIRNIETFDKEVYEQNVTAFLDKYEVHEDGHASERAAQFISSLIGE